MSSADQYRAAGVDLDAADAAKQRIAASVAATQTAWSRGVVGAFGGMVRVPTDVDAPTLVCSTDGVGTKVLVAIAADRHDTVGEDLVNHSVNDILVHGARPLAFLDYLAVAGVTTEVIAALVEGVARGCRAHDMALIGGETAQLPDLYQPGHYDLAGTIIGVVDEGTAVHGDRVEAGDVLVGYAASGLHTNGYTLARRIVFEDLGLAIDDPMPDHDDTVADVLLKVHRSYHAAIAPILDHVHGLAHITGGGIEGNLARSLPQKCAAHIDTDAWAVPPLFSLLATAGGVSRDEMFDVFNMGLGMIGIVPPAVVSDVQAAAGAAGVETWVVGEVRAGSGIRLG